MDENTQGSAPQAPMSNMKTEATGLIGKLEAVLTEYMVTKAPFQLPMGAKEIIVKIAPYLTLVLAILALPIILAALGLTTAMAPAAMMGGYHWGLGLISMIFSIGALVLELMAVPGLFKRSTRGWRLVFYASLVSLIGSLLSLQIVSGIIGAVIGWYFLFQVKELYH